jgi:hypothetical protein
VSFEISIFGVTALQRVGEKASKTRLVTAPIKAAMVLARPHIVAGPSFLALPMRTLADRVDEAPRFDNAPPIEGGL